MKGTISFHPVRMDTFERLLEPLVAGGTVNPEEFLDSALRARTAAWRARGVTAALELIIDSAKPAGPPEGANLWERIRTRLERFDHEVDPLARLVIERVDPELHLRGRPFFITENSAKRVVEVVDDYLDSANPSAAEALAFEQLSKLDKGLEGQVEADDSEPMSPNMSYRRDLMGELTELHKLGQAARDGQQWATKNGERELALNVLLRELPYRAVQLHSRATPFWIADDVDGLETVCRSAAIEPPPILASARSLFMNSCDEFSDLGDSLQAGMEDAGDIGAFVAPGDIDELMDFLHSQGGRIIQAAARQGVGDICENVLRKIKECTAYAQQHGLGYLEASGIQPVHELPD